MRRLRSALVLPLAALAACSSVRDHAVPACPYCGDPETHERPDGTAEVTPRWRLATWTRPADETAPTDASVRRR
jgi:hypothetical protein